MLRSILTYIVVLAAFLANGQKQLHANPVQISTQIGIAQHGDDIHTNDLVTNAAFSEREFEYEAVEIEEEENKHSIQKKAASLSQNVTVFSAIVFDTLFGQDRSKTPFQNIVSQYTLSKKFVLFQVFRI